MKQLPGTGDGKIIYYIEDDAAIPCFTGLESAG